MRPSNSVILNAVSANGNPACLAQWALDIVRASFQIVATSANAGGSVQLQASDDKATGMPPNQFQPTNWVNIGSPVTLTGVDPVMITETEMSYEYLRIVYTSTVAGVQTVALVADVAGSLNSTYFLLNSGNNTHKYYVWFDNGSGVDPAVPGRTAIHVTYTNNDTAATIGTTMATQIAAAGGTNDFTTSGTSTVTVTNKVAGAFTPAVDGAAPTGFTFTVTAPTGTLSANMKAMAL